MRKLIRLAAWLYPPRWRRRYGVEFDALLEDIRPGWRELFSVLKGALAMQVRRVGLFAAGLALAGALVAGLVSWRIPDKYVSTALVSFGPAEAAKEVAGLIETTMSRSSLVAILKKHKVYESEWTQKPLEDLILRMRLAIRINRVGDTAFTVAFPDEDPARARLVTRDLINILMANNVAERRAAAADRRPFAQLNLEVRDPANLPRSPSSPNRPMMYGLGIATGALTGVGVAWLRRRQHPKAA